MRNLKFQLQMKRISTQKAAVLFSLWAIGLLELAVLAMCVLAAMKQ